MRIFLVVLVTLTLAAFVATSARAANVPDPRLDAVVSEIAGTPISVLCETDAAAWAQTVQGFPFLRDDSGNPITDPTILLGFTIVGSPRVWLSPKICLELRSISSKDDTVPPTTESSMCRSRIERLRL